jgi:hypothetical protein
MAEITVQVGWCEEHLDRRHMVDVHGKCYGKSMQDMKLRGYFYERHVGGGWYRFSEPHQLRSTKPWNIPEPEPPEHNIHILDQDW